MYDLLPIAILLGIISLVVWRLPRVEVGHTEAFRRRRFLNWFPLGLTYAFLYMGRYNLNAAKYAKTQLIDEQGFGTIFGVGAFVYGFSFLLNGPLADRYGGRKTILAAALGSCLCNVLMALAARSEALGSHVVLVFSVLYGLNMYFQSFGAVAIVKVNSSWFHVRERGTFGGIFGILISLGLYFAFDWGRKIVDAFDVTGLFLIPAAILGAFFFICLPLVFDHPSDVGHRDFDAGDASSGDTGPRPSIQEVAARLFSNPVIVVIIAIEFCSGFLRNAIMQWYLDFAKGMGLKGTFVPANWGMLLCVAGILGGTFAGIVSDHLFQSRRAPVSSFLYGIMVAGAVLIMLLIQTPVAVGWIVLFMSLAVIGVHGMLSGTASADFGGKKNAGVAVGIIDGFVYLGTGLQSLLFGHLLPNSKKDPAAAALVGNWKVWPLLMLPAAVVGFLLALRIWNARPTPRKVPVPGDPSTTGESSGPQSARPKRATRASQGKVLEQVLEAIQAAGPAALVVFDLDSTLLDNRVRQARILREWAATRTDADPVRECRPEHLDGWDLRVAMVNAGLPKDRAEALFPEAKDFWRKVFFTSEYCRLDEAVPGARDFVRKVRDAGAAVAYVTGRQEEMRRGTVESFERHGFPVPDGKTVHLVMKPVLADSDDQFKRETHARLEAYGRVVAAFDNEPLHANDYKARFPEAVVVHLDTDQSGRPVEVLASIPSVLDFAS